MTTLHARTLPVADVDEQLRLAAALDEAVLVPARHGPASPHPRLGRVLVPLEGDAEPADALAQQLRALVDPDAELVVLHVFTPETAPPVLDQPVRDLELWAREFLNRYFPDATRMECRPCDESLGQTVAAFASEAGADVIAVAWGQDASAGHAAVVRDLLSRSEVPVLLLPARVPDTPRAHAE